MEPSSGQMPQTPPASVPPPPPKNTNGKTIHLILGVVLFLLCMGGVATAFWMHNTPQFSQDSIATSENLSTSTPTTQDEFYTASTTNPDFNTYTNKTLGFSIDVPKAVYSDIAGCRYETKNQWTGAYQPSYRFESGTSSIPLAVQVIGNTAYLDFAYYYDLVQKASGSPDYSDCKKQDMAWYLPIYLSKPYGDPFWPHSSPTRPVSIEIKAATTTDDAKAIAEQELSGIAGSCPYTMKMLPASQAGVLDFVGQSPSPSSFDYSSLGEDQPLTCLPWSPIIKYSTQAQKVVIITDVYQYCPFSKNSSSHLGAPDCWNRLIDSSFKFVQ